MDKSDSTNRTAYLTAINVDDGFFIPAFGQVIQGQFNTNRITVDDDSTHLYLAGSYESAITFGDRKRGRAIKLPAPNGREALAVAHFTPK